MIVLSYGGGVQTRAMVQLILGDFLPRPDRIVFADTGEEPAAIYTAVTDDAATCEAAGIPFDIVSEGRRLGDAILEGPGVYIPAFTFSAARPEGRYPFKSCTDRFKRAPIVKHLKALGWERWTTWLGMTTDEIDRVKPSKVTYSENAYPLIDLHLRRGDCEAILARAGIAIAKSSCVICPNHSRAMWRTVAAVPADMARAVEIDAAIRDREDGCQTYLHRARAPLSDCIDLTQASLFGDDCEEGYCGT